MNPIDQGTIRDWLDRFDKEHVYVGDAESVELSDLAREGAPLLRRLLALVLKHEWCAPTEHGNEYGGRCPECGTPREIGGGSIGNVVGIPQQHKAGCEWGAVCDAARGQR